MRCRYATFTILILFFFPGIHRVQAQKYLRVVAYNLLNYNSCSGQSTTDKNAWNKTIVKELNPTILGVCEMESLVTDHMMFLDSVMNSDGVGRYKRAEYTNQAVSNLTNQLYYDSTEIELKSQHVLSTALRDINLYKLYYRASDIATRTDTTWLNVIMCHLKAGSDQSDQDTREIQVNDMMSWLSSNETKGNFLVMGDFNVRSSSETSYQLMVNPANPNFRFNDPINWAGDWHNDVTYAAIHTQSTRTTFMDCGVTGGLDDRFDFILMSDDIMNNTKGYWYVTGSYKAVGQDGNHFNKSIDDTPVNATYSAAVIDALKNNSDHLPIYAEILATASVTGTEQSVFQTIKVLNSVIEDQVRLSVSAETDFDVEVFDLLGRVRVKSTFSNKKGVLDVNTINLEPGSYLIRITLSNGSSFVKKIIKPGIGN